MRSSRSDWPGTFFQNGTCYARDKFGVCEGKAVSLRCTLKNKRIASYPAFQNDTASECASPRAAVCNTSRKKRDRNGSETAGKRKAKNNIKQQILCGGVKAVSWKLRRMNVLLGTENKQKEAA